MISKAKKIKCVDFAAGRVCSAGESGRDLCSVLDCVPEVLKSSCPEDSPRRLERHRYQHSGPVEAAGVFEVASEVLAELGRLGCSSEVQPLNKYTRSKVLCADADVVRGDAERPCVGYASLYVCYASNLSDTNNPSTVVP